MVTRYKTINIREEIAAHIKKTYPEYELAKSKAKYDSSSMIFTFELYQPNDSGRTQAQEDFVKYSFAHGLDEKILKYAYRYHGTVYKILGYLPNRRTNVMIYTKNGKEYIGKVSHIKQIVEQGQRIRIKTKR